LILSQLSARDDGYIGLVRNMDEQSKRRNYHHFFIWFVIFAFFWMMSNSIAYGLAEFDNNFHKRKYLIENFNHLKLKIGDRVFSQVLIGQDGWMEYTGGSNLDDFQNSCPITDESVHQIARNIQLCTENAQKQGRIFLVLVAPNKASIYPDKLPSEIRSLADKSRLEKIGDYLEQNNLPKIINPTSALKLAREDYQVYFQTDTHWNSIGAYVAYIEIIKTVSQYYPEIKAFPIKKFGFKRGNPIARDLADLIQAKYIVEADLVPVFRDAFAYDTTLPDPFGFRGFSSTSDKSAPSLMMFGDSFGFTYLNDFLKMHFSRSFYFHRDSSSKYLNNQIFDQFDPDIIIYQVVERNLQILETDLINCAQNK